MLSTKSWKLQKARRFFPSIIRFFFFVLVEKFNHQKIPSIIDKSHLLLLPESARWKLSKSGCCRPRQRIIAKVIIKGKKIRLFFSFVKWHRNFGVCVASVVSGHFFCSVALLKFHFLMYYFYLLAFDSVFERCAEFNVNKPLFLCVRWIYDFEWMSSVFSHQFFAHFLEWEMSFSLKWMAKF